MNNAQYFRTILRAHSYCKILNIENAEQNGVLLEL